MASGQRCIRGLETVRCFAPAANRFNTALGRQSDGM